MCCAVSPLMLCHTLGNLLPLSPLPNMATGMTTPELYKYEDILMGFISHFKWYWQREIMHLKPLTTKRNWKKMWLCINSLWPSDVIWQQGSRSTLAQVMACCLTAPSHYLKQCWLMISGVLWHSPKSNFTENTQDICHWNEFEIY